MTMFETLGNRCALCALEPRIREMRPFRFGGLSWEESFALGWFLGRYTTDAPSYCDDHRVRIESLRKELARVGVVSMASLKEMDDQGGDGT